LTDQSAQMTTLRESERAGPAIPAAVFGSYDPREVTYVVKDLGDLRLEVPSDEYEARVSRGQHYAELLPLEECRPSPEGVALFHRVLARSARRLALAVGVAAEAVLARHDRPPVLVSLAQTGTPIGILLRRWLLWRRGLELPHYTISIVRGRGVDANALACVRARHPEAGVQFVDGWTGKGAITRELGQTPAEAGLAVLADPAACAPVAGTREDLLVPNACLNATVSGLVSRTVVVPGLIGPGDFHGARFYRGLTGEDVSGQFLDAVTAEFASVRGQVDAAAEDGPARPVGPPTRPTRPARPSWAGWRLAGRLAREYRLGDVNLVKAGVSETVRMLLYRNPWRVLARPEPGGDLDAVLLLARHLRVPVERCPELGPYTTVGLMRPPGRS
jgi:hypothetical protein